MNKKPAKPRADRAAIPPADADQLVDVLMAFGRFMRRLLAEALPDSCSFVQLKTLEFIRENGTPSMREVAGEMKISSPAATMIIERLVESGELNRLSDPDDRRIVRLSITPKGAKSLDTGMALVRGKLKERLSGLDPESRARTVRALRDFMK